MRVGILTYHYVYNEGAIWQACALCDYLRKTYPAHRFEMIDYRHASKYRSIVAMRQPEIVQCYDTAIGPYVGPVKVESDDADDLFAVLPGAYGAVIVGSDIVWQFDAPRSFAMRWRTASEKLGTFRPSMASGYAWARDVKNRACRMWRETTRPDPRRIPYPNAYWLSPELPLRKAAYAVSIGYSRPEALAASQRLSMRNHVAAFDFVSVRDDPTRRFLQVIDPALAERAVQAPDPAWLHDAPLPDISERFRQAGVPKGVPLAGVLFPRGGRYGERLSRWVIPRLKARGFHVVSVIDPHEEADANLAAAAWSPVEWWSVIRSLDFLVTVRTHPSIAALKYGTPLFNVDITAMQNRCRHSKSRDMLATFGLEEVCLHRREDFNERAVCAGLAHALDRAWDWPAIAARTEQHRQQARTVCAAMMEALARP